MPKKRDPRKIRSAATSNEEAERLNEIRRKVREEFPPAATPHLQPVAEGVGARVRQAREARDWSWYKLAQVAGIPNPNTVRDIEYGRDAKLSNIEAIAAALGLRLELVEEATR
jgi:ribosome-binding protein aMBF1 (putative translation factor)